MNKYRILFVGVGSIARRHIDNLIDIAKGGNIEFMIDAFRTTGNVADGVKNVYTNIDDVPNDYDVVFITNPTRCHLKALEQFKDHGRNFFIEKPIVSMDQLEKAKLFQPRKDAIYYVACPLRYCSVVQYIKNNIDVNKVLSVRSISSSYLPEWRPGQDYRKTYSAQKSLGGGVSTDLIHEWDYLTYLFGWPNKVFSLIGKKSSLEIDCDDYAVYIADYDDKVIELHLDYFGRKSIREVQLITKDETIICDLINSRIHYLNSDETVSFLESRDDYQKRELNHFLKIIQRKAENNDEFAHGISVLQLTQGEVVV